MSTYDQRERSTYQYLSTEPRYAESTYVPQWWKVLVLDRLCSGYALHES
jgi:hypothetical protein